MKQGFAWWSFADGRDAGAELLESAWSVGMRGVDFLPRDLWSAAKEIGFELLAMDGHPSIDEGFNARERHEELLASLRSNIDLARENGVRYVTVTSGRKVGVSPRAAVDACVDALGSVVDAAQQAGVTMLLEPLNTRYDHPDHDCDTVEWARAVVDTVRSPALAILFDVYHVQTMQGDLVNRYRENAHAIRHVHTAGVPGRHEIGDEQEINYRGFARALREGGYDGWVVHEFLPSGDPVAALREAHAVFAR